MLSVTHTTKKGIVIEVKKINNKLVEIYFDGELFDTSACLVYGNYVFTLIANKPAILKIFSLGD